MLHACFTPIALYFVYILWHFYVFSRTNILTRCHSASSCFLLFSIPDIYQRKYPQNWMKQSLKFVFFCHIHRVQSRDGGGHRGGHTMPWCGPTSGRAWLWCGPLGRPPISPFRLYIAFLGKTLNRSASIHKKFRSAAAIEGKFWGDRNLCSGTLPGLGIAPGAISIDSTAIFIAIADSHDEEGVVLPRC
jgi:hypothetical protein